jgi:hypothetical protein
MQMQRTVHLATHNYRMFCDTLLQAREKIMVVRALDHEDIEFISKPP